MSDSTDKNQPKGLTDVDGRLKERVDLDADAPSVALRRDMLVNVGPGMLVIALLVAATYLVPQLEFARPIKEGDPVPFWNVLGRPFEAEQTAESEKKTEDLEALAQDVLSDEPPERAIAVERDVLHVDEGDELPPYEPHPDDDKPVERSIELFAGDELDGFFASLARTDAGIAGATTRVVHWGDSAIGVDGIPSAIRTRMQARFGDAGHGFHLVAPPNTSYRHKGVKFRHNEGWTNCFIIQKCRSDGHYGLGGATFRSDAGGESIWSPDAKHSAGRVSAFEIWYQGSERGGKIKYRVDEGEQQVVDTKAEGLVDRWERIELEDGEHRLELKAQGSVRLYGITMEREGPGVVWDSLALVGAFTKRMLEFDEAHLRGQLERRDAKLAVFTFGGNDMIRKIKMSDYTQEYREVIALVKRADPDIACLVMSPLDHGLRQGSRIVSLPVVSRMVEAQRAAAKAEGCAFFDTWSAMGGEGSAARWYRHTPRLIGGDLSHATHNGHAVVGEMLYRSLMEAYVAYRKRTDSMN